VTIPLKPLARCVEDVDGERCNEPATVIIWGRLMNSEALGPKCDEHAARHMPDRDLGQGTHSAVFRLAGLVRTTTAPPPMVLLLDPAKRAGRTGHRLKVKDAKFIRGVARSALGASRDDGPRVADILLAAKALSALLFDATNGDAKLMVDLGGASVPPAVVIATLSEQLSHAASAAVP
jgi:hypothetical protein